MKKIPEREGKKSLVLYIKTDVWKELRAYAVETDQTLLEVIGKEVSDFESSLDFLVQKINEINKQLKVSHLNQDTQVIIRKEVI